MVHFIIVEIASWTNYVVQALLIAALSYVYTQNILGSLSLFPGLDSKQRTDIDRWTQSILTYSTVRPPLTYEGLPATPLIRILCLRPIEVVDSPAVGCIKRTFASKIILYLSQP
jgi:hypothetical protein